MLPVSFACVFAVPTLHTIGYALLWYIVLKSMSRKLTRPRKTKPPRRHSVRNFLSMQLLGYGALLTAGMLEFSEALAKRPQAPPVGIGKQAPQRPGK